MKDLSYYDSGMFVQFLPNTKEGEQAFNELAAHTDGTGKVFAQHAKATIAQLKAAGYTVGKGKRPNVTMDDILNDEIFDELFS